jgi:hypothetical protein
MVCVGREEGLLTANSILWKVRPPELAPDFDREFSSMTRQRVQHFPFPTNSRKFAPSQAKITIHKFSLKLRHPTQIVYKNYPNLKPP